MQIVSLLAPFRCGVYQFHCNLSRGLAKRGCSITWLCSGSNNGERIAAESAEPSEGEVVAPDTNDLVERTRALVERISQISPDALICHARGDPVDFNAIRYLPASIPRVLVLHGSTLAVYRAARVIRDHVSATVAISPRIKQDLISAYGFNEERLVFIPHGVDVTSYTKNPLCDGTRDSLRILSHGRIDQEQKGVFWIPEILAEFAKHSNEWECTISGDGPDLAELKRRIARAGISDRIHYAGWTASGDVPELMSRHDVFLFPTKYEGYPISLIEAMASGCVPVASRLPGVTDWIIQDDVNGLLFPIGNVRLAAQHLQRLLSDGHRLCELRRRARESVSKYSLDCMADQYYQLLSELKSHPRQIRAAESLEGCKLSDGLKPAWWYRLPEPVKNRLRILREQIRASIEIP